MTTYHLSSSQADRANFDADMTTQYADFVHASDPQSIAQLSGDEIAAAYWETYGHDIAEMVDDVEEAKARLESVFKREHGQRPNYRVTFGEFSTGHYDPEAFAPFADDVHEVRATSPRDAIDTVTLDRCQPASSVDQEPGRQYTWWAQFGENDYARIDEI